MLARRFERDGKIERGEVQVDRGVRICDGEMDFKNILEIETNGDWHCQE